jgi:hypothetical protein
MKKGLAFALLIGLACLAPTSASALTKGPDGYGYRYIDSSEPGGPAFQWNDIHETGVHLNLKKDQVSDPIYLPFTFTFYGQQYGQVYITSTGLLTFDRAKYWIGWTSADPIPTPRGHAENIIAGFWEYLSPNHT